MTPPPESADHAPPALEVSGLGKRFGWRDALRDIHLQVPAGSSFVLFGPNGAGKSTLLRIAATRMRPTRGELKVLGMNPRRDGARVRAALGAVFHEPCLRGELTLEENLLAFAQLYGLSASRARPRLEDLTRRLGLWSRRDDPVRSFSQGMVRRAALIRSLLHEPRLWILDEPTSGLDREGVALLERLIGEHRARGGTVLLATHDLELGLRLAEGCAYLQAGAVRARGRGEVEKVIAEAPAPAPAPAAPLAPAEGR